MKNVYIAIVIVAVVAVVALSAVFLRGRFSKSEQGAQIPEAATQEEKGNLKIKNLLRERKKEQLVSRCLQK